ncbi:hypothetical protein [Piscinibacter sp. HJYY11]|uniref:hypothetical protein n=1 Tax=Piscinibacter sp. HJYY11 TaxID=2801333 RepID=UPI0019202CAA|nr:hypothetical protein [Piscinibacter sp. HJYY11]MBL0729790.1 hypothetical protein [Piscinibacter sp. HJYY11]
MYRTLRLACVATLVAAFAVSGARAADAPPSIASLFQRVPDLPATAEEAATWVDKTGRLAHPGLLALKADIAAHQRAMEQVQLATAQDHQAQGAVVAENLNTGLANIGIDMARMQRDPAYAQEVQDRMRRMSPQELMAMSQKMNAPLNADPRLRNQAQAMVDDVPAVRAAAEAGRAYSEGQLARLQSHQQLWREADDAAAKLRQKPLQAKVAKPKMEWENIGCDAGCRAAWDAYASAMLPLMIARDTEALRLHRATLQRHRAAVADGLKAADKHLVASQYGVASRSQAHRGWIAGYDAAALGEISFLVERITDSVRSAAVVAHCGKQIVLAPGAVCR